MKGDITLEALCHSNCALFDAVPKLLSLLLKRMSNAANKILQCHNDVSISKKKISPVGD